MADTTSEPVTADRVAAYLAEVRKREQAATTGPWRAEASHGRDIADDGWSDCRVTDADGRPVAITYLTNVIEPDGSDESEAFIIAARSAVPRLLAAAEAALALCGGDRHPLISVALIREAITSALLGEAAADG